MIRWFDTKVVPILIKWQKDTAVKIEKKQKDEEKIKTDCPIGMKFHKETMDDIEPEN